SAVLLIISLCPKKPVAGVMGKVDDVVRSPRESQLGIAIQVNRRWRLVKNAIRRIQLVSCSKAIAETGTGSKHPAPQGRRMFGASADFCRHIRGKVNVCLSERSG